MCIKKRKEKKKKQKEERERREKEQLEDEYNSNKQSDVYYAMPVTGGENGLDDKVVEKNNGGMNYPVVDPNSDNHYAKNIRT